MVLHPCSVARRRSERSCFSPLLEGDGLASDVPSLIDLAAAGFSPLLEGDGLASIDLVIASFVRFSVSVPFSKGMVLHP